MFGRIIVATDLTDATRASLRVACELRHSQGEILLVHVIRPIEGVSEGELGGFFDRLRADAAARMRDLSSWFARERHIDIPCLVAMGDPAREIDRIARKREADLIVVSHGVPPAPLGSVSYKLAHLAPCAMLMLQAPTRAGEPTRSKAARRAGTGRRKASPAAPRGGGRVAQS
jgi:nucleotide-binding universal stress UspA family protein